MFTPSERAEGAAISRPRQNAASVTILGVRVHALTWEAFEAQAADFVRSGQAHQVVTVNPEFIMAAQHDPAFGRVLAAADLALADGWGLLWAARRFGKPLPTRITGSDGVPRLAALAAREGWRVFLLGAGPGIAEQAAAVLQARHPALHLAGCFAGSPRPDEEDAIVARIAAARPHVLFVAYGAPNQDLWIARTQPRLQIPLAMGFGWRRSRGAGAGSWPCPASCGRCCGHDGGGMMLEVASLVGRLAGQRVVVIGDLCLDEYVMGVATRLSREAPVPVLELRQRLSVPGGAANPASNIVALGSQATVIGVIGADAAGDMLTSHLRSLGIDTAGIVTDAQRPTTTKTRIVAQGSLRFPQHLDTHVERLLAGASAVLISDYRTGVVSADLIATVQAAARQHGVLTTVDSQGDLGKFRGFDLVRCNAAEAEAQVGFALHDDHDFERALVRLQRELSARRLVVTRGGDGVSLLAWGDVPRHLPAWNREEVFDVTGAGDTVIAVLTLALAGGLDLRTAAHLAMTAAGLVVRRLGNAVVTPAELAEALER